MASEIKHLVELYEPARIQFATLREQAGLKAMNPSAVDSLRDWIVLNEVLGEGARTITWFDQVKQDQRYATSLDRMSHALVRELEPAGRLGDIGRLYRDPMRQLAAERENLQFAKEVQSPPEGFVARSERRFRDRAAFLVACLAAAERHAHADAVRAEALRLDDTDEMRDALALRRV